jgi:hypothetical protein
VVLYPTVVTHNKQDMEHYENLNFSKLRTCNQLWEEMSPTEGGRICKKCSRTIVDFTDKTNTEIARIHLKNKTGVCGYYRPEQFEKKNDQLKETHFVKFKAILLTMISYLTIIQTTEGKEKNKAFNKYEQISRLHNERELVIGKNDRLNSITKDTVKVNTVTVAGTVKFESGGPAPGVAIWIEGTDVGTATDVNGEFALRLTDLPDSVSTLRIIAHFIGYLRVERELSARESSAIEIILDEDYSQFSDFIIIKIPWYKKFWYEIKRPFRRRSG